MYDGFLLFVHCTKVENQSRVYNTTAAASEERSIQKNSHREVNVHNTKQEKTAKDRSESNYDSI